MAYLNLEWNEAARSFSGYFSLMDNISDGELSSVELLALIA
jgi:hypothetical protein